jgi:hypothetical protein
MNEMNFQLSDNENEPLLIDPFPHQTIQNFFAPETYVAILKNRPALEEYNRVAYIEGLASHERFEYWPHYRRKIDERAQFWSAFEDFFAEAKTIEKIFAPFQEVFKTDAVLNKYWNEGLPVPRLRLVREHCPFTLPVHLDMPTKILVIVVYLDGPGDSYENGTTLYRVDNEEFVPVKKTTFTPNSALLTARTPNSWHGGTWSREGVRNTFHIYYFSSKYAAGMR